MKSTTIKKLTEKKENRYDKLSNIFASKKPKKYISYQLSVNPIFDWATHDILSVISSGNTPEKLKVNLIPRIAFDSYRYKNKYRFLQFKCMLNSCITSFLSFHSYPFWDKEVGDETCYYESQASKFSYRAIERIYAACKNEKSMEKVIKDCSIDISYAANVYYKSFFRKEKGTGINHEKNIFFCSTLLTYLCSDGFLSFEGLALLYAAAFICILKDTYNNNKRDNANKEYSEYLEQLAENEEPLSFDDYYHSINRMQIRVDAIGSIMADYLNYILTEIDKMEASYMEKLKKMGLQKLGDGEVLDLTDFKNDPKFKAKFDEAVEGVRFSLSVKKLIIESIREEFEEDECLTASNFDYLKDVDASTNCHADAENYNFKRLVYKPIHSEEYIDKYIINNFVKAAEDYTSNFSVNTEINDEKLFEFDLLKNYEELMKKELIPSEQYFIDDLINTADYYKKFSFKFFCLFELSLFDHTVCSYINKQDYSDKIKSANDKMQEKEKQLKEKISTYKTENRNLKNQINEAKESLAKATLADEYEKEKSEMLKIIHELRKENKELSDELEKRKGKDTKYESRIETLESRIKTLSKTNAEYESDIKTHNTQITELQEYNALLTEANTYYKEKAVKADACMDYLRKCVNEYVAEKETVEDDDWDEQVFTEENVAIAKNAKLVFFVPEFVNSYHLKQYFPKSKFIGIQGVFDLGKGYDAVIVCTKGLPHSMFYNITAQCDKKDISIRHVNSYGLKTLFMEAVNVMKSIT